MQQLRDNKTRERLASKENDELPVIPRPARFIVCDPLTKVFHLKLEERAFQNLVVESRSGRVLRSGGYVTPTTPEIALGQMHGGHVSV